MRSDPRTRLRSAARPHRAPALGAAMLLATQLVWGPRPAEAAPDPTLAALLSAGGLALPLAVTAGLWLNGRGTKEGLRFDLGMTTLGLGTIAGPAVGLIYADASEDALVTLLLRTLTGAVMLTGTGLALRGDSEGTKDAGKALAVVGGIPTGLMDIYDIWAAADAASEASRRRGYAPRAEGPAIRVGPFSLCDALTRVAVCRQQDPGGS